MIKKYVPLRRNTYFSPMPAGMYMAQKHIEQAEKLQSELGESITHIKNYLFSLSDKELNIILDAYEELIEAEEKIKKTNGAQSARLYARRTLQKWKNGEVTMSGLVMERLFKILPKYMPLSAKYQIVDKLLEHIENLSTDSKMKTFYINRDVNINLLISKVKNYYENNIKYYEIPKNLEKRFSWLSENDITIQTNLVNYFKEKKKSIEINELQNNIALLIKKLSEHKNGNITELKHSITISKNTVQIIFDKKAKGIMETKPKPGFWDFLFD